VLKASIASVLALAAVAALSGCAKKDSATAPQAEAPAAQPAPQMTEPHPMPAATPGAEVDLTGIAKADGGLTVAEVYADPAKLAGQKVIVRGKVVKTNAGIMGTNWVHVRDGSGADGTNDLTVTTKGEVPKVGETVVVTAPVTLNKDFGMGYVYPVILEDAAVTVEAAQ
jgi:type IV pilus biogenesis protein CpaD/CtpE